MHALQVRHIQPGQRIRVLVVDDSVVIRRLVCHALEEEIHGPYPIRVREFDGFGPLGE